MATENDKKRSLEVVSSSSVSSHPPAAKKLKPLDELSTEGPLTQADVIFFKKEAIWRQMNQYKQQVLHLKSEVQTLAKESQLQKHIVGVLTSWYEEIINLFDEIGEDENILVSFNESEVSGSGSGSGSGDAVEGKLEAIKAKLSKAIASKVSPSSDLVSLKQVSLLKSQNEILAKDKQSLTEKLELLQSELLDLINKTSRDESITLKRVDDSRKESPNSENIKTEGQTNKEAGSNSEVKPSAANGEATPTENEQNGTTAVDTEELDNLHSEVKQLKLENEELLRQLSTLRNENQSLEEKYNFLETKLHNLDEADLEDNVYYKKLLKNNQSLQEQISKGQKLNAANIAKINELEKNQVDLKKTLETDLVNENDSLKQQLSKSEQDLVRIRTARDELLAKNTILTTQLQNQKTNKSLVELNEIYSRRIDELTNERKVTATDANGRASGEETAAAAAGSSENEKIKLLRQEIDEIEQAFKQTRELTFQKLNSTIDQENLLKKLTIEKTKADQKYFASMRVKDSLTNENKVLKQQVAKSQELIKNLGELETNYLNKIEILTKSLTDYKIIKENSLQENFNLQDEIKNVNIVKDSLQKEIDRLTTKLKDLQSEFDKLKDTNKSQSVTIVQLNQKLNHTESTLQKYKSNNTNLLLQEDQQQLEALRSIAKCSVCTKNWKDTAITVCGHVFCSSCTQERLAARLRRCPSCNKGFSSNDLLTIHL
ncbi:BRE1 [Candida theae]|uniref:E3 ubiquitin protein ligase n=1 Tax=Candida theae TaxID=1198502 RepID=A0AAD5BGZ9_9ASCO|nr:BRE1 [Candida theae]KAI5962048.1 BRE1 [Candida theae]